MTRTWNSSSHRAHTYTIEYLDFTEQLHELQYTTIDIEADSEDEAVDILAEHIPSNEILSICHE